MLPAYAGMILPLLERRRQARRAPRVCGDDPLRRRSGRSLRPVLPAYAGMILFGDDLRVYLVRAPRVCGDDPGGARGVGR